MYPQRPLKVVIASLGYKGTASAATVAEAMRRGVLRAVPQARVVVAPLGDGGDGTVEALVGATGGRFFESPAHDPLLRPVTARWGVMGDRVTAVIKVATASGLALLSEEDRDPTRTTSQGTGELLRAALERGYRHILVGLGDSATSDAGAGLARALGLRALDGSGVELPPGGVALVRLASFDETDLHPALATASIVALCDVTNPLCGPRGAAAVYGSQKGASPDQVRLLEDGLATFAAVAERRIGRSFRDLPGAGAAGGLGAGLVALCGAELRPGFEAVSEALGLPTLLGDADLVLTGEGRLDAQTASGKGLAGVARLAKEHDVPWIAAIVGSCDLATEEAELLGVDAVHAIALHPTAVPDLARATSGRIEAAATEAVRRVRAAGGTP